MKPILKAHPGWTLAEAFKMCADPDLVAARDAAEQAWRAAGEPTRFALGPTVGAERRHGKMVYRQFQLAEATLRHSFRTLLIQASLATRGRRGSPLAEAAPIPAQAWQVLKIVNWKTSIAEEPTTEKTRIFEVRVFPVLEAPDVASYLDDMPLREALDRWMTNDPEAIAREKELEAREEAGEKVSRDHHAMITEKWIGWGRYGDSGMGRMLERHELEGLSPADVVVRARFMRLIDLLSSGRIDSTGMNGSDDVPIRRAIWQRSDLRIDQTNGDLLEDVDDIESARTFRRPLFRSVTLSATRKGISEGHASDTVPTLGSKSLAHAVNTTEARRQCRAWLVAAMAQSPKQRSRPRSEWLAEAKLRWPGLSERAFNVEWSAAIQESGAIAWKRPGAPRKLVKN